MGVPKYKHTVILCQSFSWSCYRELRVIQVTESEVTLQEGRDFVVFGASGTALYANGDSQIAVTDEGMYIHLLHTCASQCLVYICI